MLMARKLFLILMFVAFTVSLSACGRKNPPQAPENTDPAYPRNYPAPSQEPDVKY